MNIIGILFQFNVKHICLILSHFLYDDRIYGDILNKEKAR